MQYCGGFCHTFFSIKITRLLQLRSFSSTEILCSYHLLILITLYKSMLLVFHYELFGTTCNVFCILCLFLLSPSTLPCPLYRILYWIVDMYLSHLYLCQSFVFYILYFPLYFKLLHCCGVFWWSLCISEQFFILQKKNK